MNEKIQIKPINRGKLNEADRLQLAGLLIKAGYTVRITVEKTGSKLETIVEAEI